YRARRQKIQLQVVEAPLTRDGREQVAQPLLRAGMRGIEAIELATPVLASESRFASGRAHQPVGMLMREPARGCYCDGRTPQARAVSGCANTLSEMRHTIWKALVETGPVADGGLISIINLYDVERK